MQINQLHELKKRLRFLMAIGFFFVWGLPAMTAQIVNGDFESGNTGFYSDYVYVLPQYNGQNVGIENGKYTVDNTSANHGIGYIGWPTVLGYGGSGNYMLVNGYGGNISPTKVAWKQTVTVAPNTNYAFSCQVVNLAQSFMGYSPNPAILKLKINGTQVGDSLTIAQNNNWHEWTNEWFSGNATQAVIEIYDVYTGDQGLGDDFGLDHITMNPLATYSVTAVDDEASVCLNATIQIDVLGNDIILPNSQGVTVQITQNPSHGTASVNQTTHKISYTFLQTGYQGGIDQIKYKVSIPHGENDEAWVYINTSLPPNVGWIDNPGPICAGGPLGIPTPTVEPDQGTGQWEKCQTQSGSYELFDPNNIPISMNGWWVRFTVTNDCGTGSSNSQQITVTNGPSITGQTPQIPAICAGGNLNLTVPAINANGSTITDQDWVAAPTENGDYTAFSLNNIPATYNGWYVRYMVESSCGFVYSNPARQLTVNVAPEITGTLQAPAAICAGENLQLTVPSYTGTNSGIWEICQTHNGTYQFFDPQNVPATYNNWYLHYKVSNDCGSDVSNYVQIYVYDAPTIATPVAPSAICAGGSFSLTTPTIQNNGSTITDQDWQIYLNGSWQTLTNNNIPYSYNGCNIRYYAENDCDVTYSQAVQVTVNDEPSVGNITAPTAICAGESFNLTVPTIQDHGSPITSQGWEIQINGVWQPLTNTNIPSDYNGCNIRYKARNGCCDEGEYIYSNQVAVTVYSTEPIVLPDVTFCQEGYYHGVWCSQDGMMYGYDSTTINNCTIHISWLFHLNEGYNVIQYQEVGCNEFLWSQNGMTYYNSGVYYDTVPNSNPVECDDVYVLNLTINHAPVLASHQLELPSGATCSGDPMNVTPPNHTNGGESFWGYSDSPNGPFDYSFNPLANNLGYGNYYLRYKVVNDCGADSTAAVPFRIMEAPSANAQLEDMTVCVDTPLSDYLPEVVINWNNEPGDLRVEEWQLSENGTTGFAGIGDVSQFQFNANSNEHYWLRFMVRNNCDPIYYIGPVQLTVMQSQDITEPHESCDTVWFEGNPYTRDTVIDRLVDDVCPYTIHHNIVVYHSQYIFDSIPQGTCYDEFLWHGQTYYRSDGLEQLMHWDTLTENGCNKVVEQYLNFTDYNSKNESRIGCGSYTWPRNDSTYFYDENHPIISDFVVYQYQDDCDSIIYLTLRLGREYEVVGEPWTECSGFEWNGLVYTHDDVIYETLQTAVTHCDSIVSHQLTIVQPVEISETIEDCQDIWWNGQLCDHDDEYYHTILSQQGCDSIIMTLHFTKLDQIVREFDTLACEPFYWYGYDCSINGMTCAHTFLTPHGCDSTAIMHVYLNHTVTETQFIPACDFFEWDGVFYNVPGIYDIIYDTLHSQEGCDSIVKQMRVEVKSSELIGQISGHDSVYVASSLVSGIYRYDLDTTDVVGAVVWSLSNPNWQIVEPHNEYCKVLVTTPGSALLKANFNVSLCGEMERTFEINADFFGVDDHQAIEVHIFPNPTKGTVNVETEGIIRVRVVDMMGQILEVTEGHKQDQVALNLSTLAPSVYLLEIETVNGMVKKRIVVCR